MLHIGLAMKELGFEHTKRGCVAYYKAIPMMVAWVGVELDVEVGVRATPTSLLFPCVKAFQRIQLGVGQNHQTPIETYQFCYLDMTK